VKHKLISKITFLFLFTGLLISQAFAQGTGKISGKITDKKSGETIIALIVRVEGHTNVTASDVAGNYTLNNLAPGKYSLTFSFLGYQTKNVTDVEVSAGKVTNVDVIMEESSGTALSEVVITTTARQESANALYAQQKNNARISDGISAESIRRSPDKNTADVLKRVSGATIQDNKFVIIRGLSDRYNTASLDNGALPSTEPNRKAFSFDIVPSNMVDNIVISKTATPDMAGDFAGGSVQIITKDIPDQNFVSFGVGTSYNSQTTFKDFKGTQKGLTDYLGYNVSTDLASNFPSTNKVVGGLTSAQNIASIRSLSNEWTVYKSTAPLGKNYQFSFGKVKAFEKPGKKIGAIFSLSYRNGQNTNPEVSRELVSQYKYTDETYKFSTNLGGLANFAYLFGNNKITFKNIYNRIQDNMYTYREGTNIITSTDNKFYAFDMIQKALLKSTLDGEHTFGTKRSKLKWTLGYSDVLNNQPDQRKISYYKNISDRNNASINYAANVTSIGKENTRLFSNLKESIYSGDVGYSTPVKLGTNPGTFKIGANSVYRDRTFNVRFIGLLLNNTTPNYNAIRERPLSTLFASDLINSGAYKLDEIGNNADRYVSNSNTNSAFVMLDNKFGEKVRLVWGVRAEQFNLHLATFDPTQPKVDRNQLDILPSANFTYAINDKSNFRASYYRTVARPEFRELSPFAYYDYEQLAIQFGNPNLKRTQIHNADLRYELYPSAFYKNFKNAIETTFYDVNSTPDITYSNAEKANAYGAELEVRKKMNFLGETPFFTNTTLYTNVSIIHSLVNYVGSSSTSSAGRPLVGQSPYVINAGIQHSELDNKLSFNLLYNRIGRRIYRVQGLIYPNVWENPRDVVDFQTGMKVIKNKGEIKLNVRSRLSILIVIRIKNTLPQRMMRKALPVRELTFR
jgi:TonB-dependent receptor